MIKKVRGWRTGDRGSRKNHLFFIFLLSSILHPQSSIFASGPAFTPYYQFEFAEGLSAPSKGDFFANQELATKVGTLWRATDKIQLFGLYDLAYEGPGLMRQEGRLFTERAIRHSFLIQPAMDVENVGKLKLKLFVISEDRRSGTNELWGKGLYDYDAKGFSLSLQREVLGWKAEPFIRYTLMKFPNYTDLLNDFQTSGLKAELSGGLMDQKGYALGLGLLREKIFLDASWSQQSYDRQMVIGPGGTYQGAKQKDSQTEISGGIEASLWRFTLVPKLAYKMKRSNQNYLRFAFFGDTSPVFVEKNYDYNQIDLGSTLFLRVTKAKSIFGSIDLYDRKYTRRATRDGSGNYTGESQHSLLGSWGGGVRWKVSDYSSWSLAYNFVFSQSNMKFERFIPYNYTGHVIGLYFSVQP